MTQARQGNCRNHPPTEPREMLVLNQWELTFAHRILAIRQWELTSAQRASRSASRSGTAAVRDRKAGLRADFRSHWQ